MRRVGTLVTFLFVTVIFLTVSVMSAPGQLTTLGVGGGSPHKGEVTLGAEAFLGAGTILSVAWQKAAFEDKPVSIRYLARTARGAGDSMAGSKWVECPHDGNGVCPGIPASFSKVTEGDSPGQQGNAGQPTVAALHFIQADVAPQNANAKYEMRIEVVLRSKAH
jgi:hypothetical protein